MPVGFEHPPQTTSSCLCRPKANAVDAFKCERCAAPRRFACEHQHVPQLPLYVLVRTETNWLCARKCRQTCLQLSGMIRTETAYAPTPTCQRWDSNPRLSGLAPGASAFDRSAKLSLFTCAQSNGRPSSRQHRFDVFWTRVTQEQSGTEISVLGS